MLEPVKVSVGLLVYNQESYVRESIEGIFFQTYQIDELIISDDHSCDDSWEIVKETVELCKKLPNHIKNCIIRRNDRNLGLIEHFNLLIPLFSNNLIVLNAGDDISFADRIERIVQKYLEVGSPKYFLCHSAVEIIDSPDRRIMRPPVAQLGTQPEVVATGMALHIGATEAFTAPLFNEFGPIVYHTYEDLVLGFRAALMRNYWYIDEPLVYYRLGGISDPEKMQDSAKWNRHVKETLRQRVADAFHCGRLDLVNLLWQVYDTTGFSLGIEERFIPAEENCSFSLLDDQLLVATPESQIAAGNINPYYSTYLTRHHTPFHPDDPLPADSPTLTFVIPCPASDLPLLADTLDSLGVQSAPLWRLVVVADAPAPDAMWAELPMLRWRAVESAEGMEDALAEELAAVESGWVSVLAPGVRLAGDAVEQLVRHALAFPRWRLMYGDSDTVEADGTRRDPLFRPDVNLDLLRSMPYLGPCLWVEREAFAAVGGWGECGEAWRYDLALRVLDAFGEEAIGHVDEVLYSVPAGREEVVDEPAHRQALAAHLARRGLEAEVAEGYVPGTWRVVYRWPRQPRVSIIIPTKDQADYLRACVESVRAKTAYPDYQILVVDNGSTQPEALAYLERLKAEGVRVLPYPKPFNFSAMCNLAAREASGEYLLLLNNDTAVLQEHWLERMVAYGQRPDVGIVGVKLMFPQPQTVQHVGVILGLGGIAEHPYLGLLGLTDGGYMNRALVDQDLSAVTAACLLIRKSVWEEVKGLDEQAFRVSYNDVDLCLKVRERGYKILWTPFVVLVHHGSVSQQQEAAEPAKARKAQQRFGKEQEAMLRKWLPQLARDPAYNRHLSLTHRDYRVEPEIVVNWDPRLPSEKVRVLGWEQLSGVIEYRIKQPLEGLWRVRAVERSFIHAPAVRQTRIPLLVEVERARPDVFTASAFLELSDHLETVRQVQELAGIPFLLHLDDLISEIPRQSEVYEHRNTPGEMKRVVRTADRVVVTTEPIRAAIEKYAREVRLIPNYLPGWVWNELRSERRVGPKPRVGWAGAMQHAGDLALIREVVKATSEECDWVFFGMCPEELRPFVKEFHPFVPFEQYPAKLASLNLDLAVAPLEVNRFNECKSNLRLLEYGILGWPVVCSDVMPYRGAPVARVPNRPEAWLEAIRARIHDLDAAQQEGEALQRWVREGWMLEDHLGEWLEAYRLGS